MIKLNFKTLSFRKDEENVYITLLKLFTTKIPVKELGNINILDQHTIEIPYKQEKFSLILSKYFKHLKNKLTGNPVTYIHRNSGIPLIGNVYFGIVYRNSSIIEIKPITSCNLNCIYCSISEGLQSKKNDFVVEKDYLVDELKDLVDFIYEPVEIHIGVQGEPFLYADIEPLIKDLQAIKNVHTISVDTNGTLLNKELIDRLARNNKLQMNFSLDTLDPKKAKKISGLDNYNVNHVKEMIKYASKKMKVIVAPVLVDGYNNDDIEKIIKFVKTLNNVKLGIQNFLRYKTGRNPANALAWEDFYSFIDDLEKEYQIPLKWTKEDFNIKETKELPKPFKRGDVIDAFIGCVDRYPNSILAVAKDRTISIPDCQFEEDKRIKIEILKDKHNIFTGKLLSG